MAEAEETYMDLEEYCEAQELKTSRAMAEHFEVSQTSIQRWKKQESLYIQVGTDGVWKEVYVEKTLATREGDG